MFFHFLMTQEMRNFTELSLIRTHEIEFVVFGFMAAK